MNPKNIFRKQAVKKLLQSYNWNDLEKLVVVFLLVILPFVFLAGFLMITSVKKTNEEVERYYQERVKESAVQISRNFSEVKLVLETLAAALTEQELSLVEVNGILEKVHSQYERIDNILLTDLEGNIISIAPGYPQDFYGEINLYDRKYFQEIVFAGAEIYYERFSSRFTDSPVLVMAIPVYDRDSRLQAVLATSMPLAKLQEEVKNIIGSTDNAGYFLLDENSRVVVDQFDYYLTGSNYSGYPYFSQWSSERQEREHSFVDFHDAFAFYAPVEFGWTFAILQPANVALVDLWHNIKPVLLVFLVILTPISLFTLVTLSGLNIQFSKLKEANQELELLANTDGLTKVYNHRYLYQMLTDALEKAKAGNQPLSVIMLDIDNFKTYNDTFGHLEGDELLKKISTAISSVLPEKSAVARFGGDEFAIVCQEMTLEGAKNLANLVRTKVVETTFSREEELPQGQVTVSLGIAGFPAHAYTVDQLLKAADIALYKAKAQSKDNIELYHSVLDELKSELAESELKLLNTLSTLIAIVNAKDSYTYGHSERVMEYSEKIAKELGINDEKLRLVRFGAFLHDIGKIEIPRKVLNKRSRLTDEEYEMIRQHCDIGAKVVAPISSLKKIIPLIKHHHEHFNGNGYPDGLKGADIPLMARIVAVADSFDAMTSNRPYSPAMPVEEALNELERCAGSQFDPRVVAVFKRIMKRELDNIANQAG